MKRFLLLGITAVLLGLMIVQAEAGSQDKGEKGKSANRPEPPLNVPPPGFTALFNGKNLDGWQGAIPFGKRSKMSDQEREAAQKAANEKILPHWKVENGILTYNGKGHSLGTVKDYGDFELYVDWKIGKNGDSGIYLRGQPQVQIWDNEKIGKVGSGGLYNNKGEGKNPKVNADYPVGQWNTFYIIMKGDRATIYLNGIKVVDNAPLDNYWEKGQPLPATGPIELQHHGDPLWFRNIYIKEL